MSESEQDNLELERKYKQFKEKDPFPKIAPALLNSADIEDYVNTTGMISPFCRDDLKSASYGVKIKGKCVFWDKKGVRKEIELVKDTDTFVLEPNSIAFVEVEPTFRLPNYIALRFNLTITNVYRGLLLGTGPLVDPGYQGKLYIPLHNLTTNHYTFECGEPLIWMEFTKTSKIHRSSLYKGVPLKREGEYKPFPEKKTGKSLEYFLNKACKGGMISSSLPAIIDIVDDSVTDIESLSKDVSRKVGRLTLGGGIGLVLGVVAIAFPAWQLQISYNDNVNQVK